MSRCLHLGLLDMLKVARIITLTGQCFLMQTWF